MTILNLTVGPAVAFFKCFTKQQIKMLSYVVSMNANIVIG